MLEDRAQSLGVCRLDRLSAVSRAARVLLLTSLVLWGCGGDTATPQRSRVEGVKAVATPDITRFCDATWPVQLGPPLTLPRVEPARPGTVVPQLATDRFVWVNLWATWCGPCRREMPVVLKLAERLQAEGVNVDVWFVSIDEAEDYLAQLLTTSPEVAPGRSVRVVSPKEFEHWMRQYTSAPATSIPINLMAGPGGRVRCLRVGSLREGDYPVVRAVFR